MKPLSLSSRKLPPLHALLAFESAARLGRMTLAAEALSVSPGAISKQVKKLEQWLGTELFEGTKNNPQLTTAGATFLAPVSQAFAQISDSVDALRATQAAQANTLKIACYSSFAAKWLLPRLDALRILHPNSDVMLSARQDIDARRLGSFDAIVIAQARNAPMPAGLMATVLFDEWIGPVVSAEAQKTNRFKTAADLINFPLLSTQSRPELWSIWAQKSKLPAIQSEQPSKPKPPPYQHYYFAIEAALRGQGVALAPWHLVMDDLHAKRLQAPLGFIKTGLRYVALHQAQPRPEIASFCAWLAAQASAPPSAKT